MAKNQNLPSFREKRKILFSEKTSRERMRATGELFMQAGRYDDALELFERAEARDLTGQIAALAMDSGNTPLYMRAKKILKEEITDREWTALAANAEKAGMYSAAYVAHLRAGHEEEAARIRSLAQSVGDQELQATAPDQETEQAPAEGEPGDRKD